MGTSFSDQHVIIEHNNSKLEPFDCLLDAMPMVSNVGRVSNLHIKTVHRVVLNHAGRGLLGNLSDKSDEFANTKNAAAAIPMSVWPTVFARQIKTLPYGRMDGIYWVLRRICGHPDFGSKCAEPPANATSNKNRGDCRNDASHCDSTEQTDLMLLMLETTKKVARGELSTVDDVVAAIQSHAAEQTNTLGETAFREPTRSQTSTLSSAVDTTA